MKANEIGIAGEVRCVITRADGSVKEDTGFQKNLILNQGLEFFGGGGGRNINTYCAIGSGNSTPEVTQTKLDSYIKQVSGGDVTSSYSYEDKGDNLYRMWEQKRYRFTGLEDVNISEVGLVSSGIKSSNYYLTTRTLMKDSSGSPTTITIKEGETLDVYYKIHKVVDVSDKTFVINVLDGEGGSVPYNVIIRPHTVGKKYFRDLTAPATSGSKSTGYSTGIVEKEGKPSTGVLVNDMSPTFEEYTPSSYKVKFTFKLSLVQFNGEIKSFACLSPFYHFQMQMTQVDGGLGITKSNKETLDIPLEFSWGRFEGEL